MGHIIVVVGIVGLLVYLLRRNYEGIAHENDAWPEDTDACESKFFNHEEPTLEDPSAYPFSAFSSDRDDEIGRADWIDAYHEHLHKNDDGPRTS
jgi:hypothetical protein